jgi:hypothetical protein
MSISHTNWPIYKSSHHTLQDWLPSKFSGDLSICGLPLFVDPDSNGSKGVRDYHFGIWKWFIAGLLLQHDAPLSAQRDDIEFIKSQVHGDIYYCIWPFLFVYLSVCLLINRCLYFIFTRHKSVYIYILGGPGQRSRMRSTKYWQTCVRVRRLWRSLHRCRSGGEL